MAIQRYNEGGGLERRVGLKAAAKKAPAKKHAAKKVAAKKHAAKKHAAKRAHVETLELGQRGGGGELLKAFHHLQRAAAVISLVDETGEDLRMLLGHGTRIYGVASKNDGRGAGAALGLARAAEHLSLCGLAMAREEHRPKLPLPGQSNVLHELVGTRERLEALAPARGEGARWLVGLAAELVRRGLAEEDAHLAWEYAGAAEGICVALEEGV